VASAEALAAFRASVVEPTAADLVAAVEAANRAVFERSSADVGLSGMGTTLCGIALVAEEDGPRVAIVNVGDSRVYLLSGDEFVQLTEDHSLVETMVREGSLTPDEAVTHPRRNVVTRALGIDLEVEVDSWAVEPHPGDRFLLCSVGLFNEIHADQISAVLRRLADPDEAAHELVRLANAAGGRDNITVVVVDVVDTEDPAAGWGAAEAPLIGTRVDRLSEPVADPLGLMAPPAAAPVLTESSPVPATRRKARPRREGRWRTALFVLAVLAVFGLAFAAIAYTARSVYFVGSDRGSVVIYRGRPGGLLWFQPTIEERTEIRRGQLTERMVDAVDSNTEQPDLMSAQELVDNIREGLASSTTTTTTVPTTLVPTTLPATTVAPAVPAVPGAA
jgi:serine/threonine protein phosphatase PrpC